MRTKICFYTAVGFFLLASCSTKANAQPWAQKMFEVTKFDFGVVARASNTRHRFRITNKYKQTIHIANVRTTCGCSAATPSQRVLKSGEVAYIEVVMDTTRFTRRKDTNLIVTFGAPYVAEVRIPITAYIRTDVVLSPGSVNFGAVQQGAPAERTITLAYAGRPNWRVNSIKINSKHLTGKIVPLAQGGGRINYQLVFTLKGTAPTGILREQITLVTNDAQNPFIPVAVEARVESDIVVTVPSLGTVTVGQKKSFNIGIRGKKPFKIESIQCKSGADCYQMKLSKSAKRMHILPIKFTPPNRLGPFQEQFTVKIAGRPQPVIFKIVGRIAAKP